MTSQQSVVQHTVSMISYIYIKKIHYFSNELIQNTERVRSKLEDCQMCEIVGELKCVDLDIPKAV